MGAEGSGGTFGIHNPKGEMTAVISNSPTHSSKGLVYIMAGDNWTDIMGK